MEKENYQAAMMQICSLVANDDAEVAAELKECLADTELYVNENLENYSARGMSLEDNSVEDCQWLGMADSLIAHGYAVELDWKESLEDFAWKISSLRPFKQLGLALDDKFSGAESSVDIDDFDSYDDDDEYDYEREEEMFDQQDIPYWCKYLDNQWFDEDICIGQIDIQSDSYVLFITEPDILEKLEDIADTIDRRISSVF